MLAVPLTDYYEEVRRYLTCPEEVKDDLIYDVNRKVMDLNADRPDLDYDDVVDFSGRTGEFGTVSYGQSRSGFNRRPY